MPGLSIVTVTCGAGFSTGPRPFRLDESIAVLPVCTLWAEPAVVVEPVW
jgi:hypothetical protein